MSMRSKLRQNSHTPLWKFGSLYEMACQRCYFVPIHHQLVESFYSKFDTCAKKTDTAVIDSAGCCQFRLDESGHFRQIGATGEEIHGTRTRATSSARATHSPRKRVLGPEGGAAVLELVGMVQLISVIVAYLFFRCGFTKTLPKPKNPPFPLPLFCVCRPQNFRQQSKTNLVLPRRRLTVQTKTIDSPCDTIFPREILFCDAFPPTFLLNLILLSFLHDRE